jgi:hypothetical protein
MICRATWRGAAVCVAVLMAAGRSLAQAPPDGLGAAERVQALIDRTGRAIVKISVDGKAPDGSLKRAVGSGAFVFSANGISVILTAAHVIGSSETEQSKNPDWQVENGTVIRRITVSSLDERGSLTVRAASADVMSAALPAGADIALLTIQQSGYVSLPFADRLTDLSGLKNVTLLGFQAERIELSMPPQTGIGHLDSSTKYVTTVPSRRGESGAPWIDSQSGLILAVAKGIESRPGSVAFEATPVLGIGPAMQPYISSLPPQSLTLSYKMCTGEDRYRCPSDAIHRDCGFSVAGWAEKNCGSYTAKRLDSFDGNKCGYEITLVVCTSPRAQ